MTTTTDWTTDAEGTGQYAEVNGINLYFETHGAGRPLILLHGGLGSGEMFGPLLTALAERHQVIAVDLQGHGRTADIDRPIDVRLMADDIAALIDHLGLDKPDVVGYSLGGGVALRIAAKYPAKVGRLVTASANIRTDAIYPEMRAQQGQVSAAAAEFMTDTPMYQLYQRVAPRPEDFPRLLDKIGEAMSKDFDWRCCIKRSSRSPAAKLLVRSNSAAQLGLEDLDKSDPIVRTESRLMAVSPPVFSIVAENLRRQDRAMA